MRRVLKYEIEISDNVTTITVPNEYALIRHFGEQHERLFIWLEVDDEYQNTSPCKIPFRVFGTGQEIPDFMGWKATVQMKNGLVWHVYLTICPPLRLL